MPQFVHVFQSGRMNKDLDERLVPNGEYRDALNLDLADSENGNVGSLQNIKGTIELRGKGGKTLGWTSDYIDSLSNPECIGVYNDDLNERIYWFIASDDTSVIAEYDQPSTSISPVLVDKNNILNFSKDYLITGINIIDGLLFWTDNQTEPKKINIEKFKAGSCDFNTHTKIPVWDPEQNTYAQVDCTANNAAEFTEEDITVIKKSPLAAPTITASASRFGENVPGTGLTPVTTQITDPDTINFTYKPNTVIAPDEYKQLDTYGEYLTNINSNPNFYANSSIPGWNGEITFQVSSLVPSWTAGESIVTFKTKYTTEYYQSYNWQVSLKIVAINNTTITGQIQAISNDIIPIYLDDQGTLEVFTWEGLLNEEAPLFEYVFPRFAFRWKYIDNEYSTFSPFSEVAFVGGEFEYLSSDGYNVGMTNNIRKLIIGNLSWGGVEIKEIDILYKESNSNTIYIVDSLKRKDYTVLPSTFQIENELIGAAVESNQILRPWDNVPRKAKAQEIIGNRIVYGNYLQNYNLSGVSLNLSSSPMSHMSIADPSKIRFPEPSVKSIRTYQAGVIFADKYGRETPVFTSKQGSTNINISNADKANKLQVTPAGDPPDWATHYKFFVKENSNEYYNLALDKFYSAEDGNVWLSFPSSERNKVDEETYLILKKQHDTDTPVTDFNRYKILAIENEAPRFISESDSVVSSANVTLQESIDIGFALLEIQGPSPTSNPQFGPNLNGGKIDVRFSGSTTDKYNVRTTSVLSTSASGDLSVYQITLSRPFGPDAGFLTNLSPGANIEVTVYEQKEKTKPEFEGRFFVKINRDFAFDTNIISSFSALETRYAILDETVSDTGRNTANNPPGGRYYCYSDNGSNYDNGSCSHERDRHKLVGWNGGVGSSLLTAPGGSQMAAWQPVTRGSKFFGIQTLEGIGTGTFVDKMFGHVPGLGSRSSASSVATPNGYLGFGQAIRFVNKNTGEYSQVYTINSAICQASRRGEIVRHRLKCKNSNSSVNTRYAIFIELNKPLEEEWFPESGDWGQLQLVNPDIQAVDPVIADENDRLSSTNPAIFETEPKEAVDLDLYYEASDSIPISNWSTQDQDINWYNCYSYGNGVESNRIRDDFNAVTIDKGPKVSTVLDEPYAAERRASGFIFSQIFNSTSGINRLNQFIQAEPITKDLNPIHGSIQKLHARDTDLITLCEDKCFRVLANKDALYNADGNSQLTGNNAVLGQTVPYAGEFGISKNPESFAHYGFRTYFSDRNRGAVIRLSRDGITVISENGMDDFFSDNIRASEVIKGSYDEDKGLYNISLKLTPEWQNKLSTDQSYQLTANCETQSNNENAVLETTVSFKESVLGWTSRKSFIPENGISLNNRYYTFKRGLIWENNSSSIYNNFYGDQYNSSFNVVINEMPNVVKGYSALNYSGTDSREIEYEHNGSWYSIAEINAGQIIPTASQVKKEGWYTNYIRTNLESGEVKEFENKEGKYFNHIKALHVCKSGDGIGEPDVIDPDPQEYILTAFEDDSCSSSGGNEPDTLQFFVNAWGHDKAASIYDLDIEPLTTAQEVKCAINDLYDIYSQNYTGITNSGTVFSYLFTDGLQVGTQMYNHLTSEPITQGGAYLFVNTPSDQTSGAVDHPGIDHNNPTAVPPSYYVMILNNNGQVSSWTQYNTIPDCASNPDMGPIRMCAGVNSNVAPAVLFRFYNNDTDLWCALKDYMQTWVDAPFEGRSQGYSSWAVTWYGPNFGGPANVELGTTIYHYSSGAGTHTLIPNQVIIYRNPLGGNIPYGEPWISSINNLGDEYFILETDSNSVVTRLDQINLLPNPTCP